MKMLATVLKQLILHKKYFLSLDSSHEPTKGTDGKPIGKKEAGREWKLPIFPIEERFYQKIMNSPQINYMVPMAYIHARWQLPIQVGKRLIIILNVLSCSTHGFANFQFRVLNFEF